MKKKFITESDRLFWLMENDPKSLKEELDIKSDFKNDEEKKKFISLISILKEILIKEDVSYTKEKSKELIEKYKKEIDRHKSNAKLLFGKFSGITMGDILEESGIKEFKRIGEAADKFYNKISDDYYKIDDIRSQMFDEYQDNKDKEAYSLSREAEAISDKYKDLEYSLEVIKEVAENIISKLDHIIEYNKLKHLKDLQQGIK